MTPESSPAASSDGPWHPPSAAAAMSRRSSMDSQATAATVVSASVEPLKTERRRSSNVSFERSAMAFSEEILGLGLSDDDDDENYDAERSIFLSPTASSLGASGNRPSNGPSIRSGRRRRGSAPTLQPSRGRFLGHWRRGRRRGSTSSLPSSSATAAASNASQGNMRSPPSAVSFFAADEGAGNQGSSNDGNDLRRDIRAALRNLDDADIDDDQDDGEEDDAVIARTVERMFGNGDASAGTRGGGSRRSPRTIEVEVHAPPPQGVVPRRSSLKSQENRRDWSHRS